MEETQPLTLQRLANNPMGKGAAVGNAAIMRHHLTQEYLRMSRARTLDIDVVPFRVGETLYLKLKVTSFNMDRNGDVNYDILLTLTPPLDSKGRPYTTSRVDLYHVSVFSNVPSFTYTYAKVYEVKGYLNTELQHLYDDDIFMKGDNIRNPNASIGFDKYMTIVTLFIINNRRLLDKSVYTAVNQQTYNHIISQLRSNSQISKEIEHNKLLSKEQKDRGTRGRETRSDGRGTEVKKGKQNQNRKRGITRTKTIETKRNIETSVKKINKVKRKK